MTLEEAVKEFLEIIDTEEVSSNGNVFKPVTIGSCRVRLTERLDKVLQVFKENVK